MFYEKKISASMRERKRLRFDLQLKSLDTHGKLAGYASVFNVIDNQSDVIEKGAFASTLSGRIGDIKMLWQHQQDEPIGIFTSIFEDELGLYVEGQLLLDVQRAKEAHALLKAGALNGLSIGYSPVRYRIDADTGIRYISEVELWEISLVTFPANSAAQVTVVKQSSGFDEEKLWKKAVSTGELVELSQTLDKAIRSLTY